jgi:hypothetical protein
MLPEPAIVSGVGDLKTGRTIWDILFLSPTLSKKQLWTIATLSALFIVGLLITACYTGAQISFDKDYRLSMTFPGAVSGEDSFVDKPASGRGLSIAELAKKARALGQPYFIIAVTDTIKVEKKTIENKQKILLYRNNVYTSQALRKINKNERIFRKDRTSEDTKPRYMPGTENEDKSADGTWNVELDMEEGEIRTFNTSAVYVYDFPLKEDRKALSEPLDPNELFISYPNDKDVIGELVMKIESESFNISPIGAGPAKLYEEGKGLIETKGVRFINPARRANSKCSKTIIASRWTNVLPNEEMGILFTVEEKPVRQ